MSSNGQLNHDLEEINGAKVATVITLSFVFIFAVIGVSFFYFKSTQSQELDRKQASVNMTLRNAVKIDENKVWKSSRVSIDDAIESVVKDYN